MHCQVVLVTGHRKYPKSINTTTLWQTVSIYYYSFHDKSYIFPRLVWSFGIIMFELLTGNHAPPPDPAKPFSRPNIKGLVIDSSLEEFVQLFKACTNTSPDKRPTTSLILQRLENWVQGNVWSLFDPLKLNDC
jgi:serine/threonine protein kinase